MAAEAGYYNYDAANTAWVKLYVNGDFHGVYTSTEQRDEQLLRNRDLYSPTNTWLYKVDGGTTLEAGVGESPTFQHLDFAPFAENGGSGGSGPDLEIDLPQWIDMESMLTLGACNAYVENNDELFKKNGKNSFAVDFEPPNQRLRMYFPWDQDSSIKQGSQSIDKNNLIFDEPWFQRVYEHTLREMIEGPLSESSLHAFLNDLEAVLAPELASDPFITSGAGDFASLRSWVTNRNANVLGQLTLPFVARPVFNQDGGEVVSGFGLTMIAPAGQVYYTLDGTDPRVPGGGLSPSAQLYSAPVSVDRTLQVVARTLDGPSLERFVVSGYGNEPLNWRATVLGGSPGQPGDFAEGIAIAQNSSWDYKVTVSALAVGWPEVTYNASSWSDGPGVLGYGETFLSTVIPFGPDPLNRYPTTYFRKPFVVNDDPATITALTLTILGDDGVAVYLNGKEVVRRSLPTGTLTYNTLATDTEATTYETIDLLAFKDCLVQGGNVLAVEVHQSGPTSTDLVWDAGLTYSTVSTAVDSDGDGMTDDWEIANGLNPGDPSDVDHDLDGDGQDSLGEFIAGTDPNDPYSVFRLTRVEFMPIGAWQVEWTSVPGKEYRVEYSPDMDTWFSFGVVGEIIATGATTQFADPSASPAEQRFYRVAVLASP